MSLQDDLARWEAGYLSREALIASYASNDRNAAEPPEKNLGRNLEKNLDESLDENLLPDGASELALVKILDLHERLGEIGSEPVPYRDSDWDHLRDGLPDRLPTRRVFGAGRLARPLIAASMVVGLTAGAAAASPTVRQQMVSVWHGIQHHIGLVDDQTPLEMRSPVSASPHAPGEHGGGGPVRTTGPGNSGDTPGHSDGTPGGGNTGSPGHSDGTPGGGNTGSPGNSDGTPGGGNSGEDPNQGNGGTDNPGQGNDGSNSGQGNGGNPGEGGGNGGTDDPGQGEGGDNSGEGGNGGSDDPSQGNGGGNSGEGDGGDDGEGGSTGP